MLRTETNFQLPLKYARYGRMSLDTQNPRSPDQQFDTIHATLKHLGYPWMQVKDFRDDGKTGQLIHNRPDFMKMINGIRTCELQIDLILLDTLERFGRMDELECLRSVLLNSHGVLVFVIVSG